MISKKVLTGAAGLGLALVVACSADPVEPMTGNPVTPPGGMLSAVMPAGSTLASVAPPTPPPQEVSPQPSSPPAVPQDTAPPNTAPPNTAPPSGGAAGSGGSGGGSAGAGAPPMGVGGELQGMGGEPAQGGSGGSMGGTAGAAAAAGATMGGAMAGVGGEGGAGGAGGSPAAGGAGGRPPPRASAGCGKANPDTGSSDNPLNDGKPYYVKLPTNYDPNMPYRLLFVFNPTGNPITWAERSAGYEGLSAKDNAIRVYPHQDPNNLSRSAGGWNGGDVSAFEPLYNAVTSNFCVDLERVFATGESSGGDFSSVLGCEHGDKLRGIGPCATKPVGGYPLNANERNCVGDVTAIIIHGLNDSVVGSDNGPATRDFYKAVNECDDMSVPVDGYTDDRSNCVMFTGCKEGYPLYWCQHQDPNYSGTQHGWPQFAAKMTWEVFEAY